MTDGSSYQEAVATGMLPSEESHRALLQSIVDVARAIYGAVGFELVDSWPNRDFGGLGLTSEKWRLKL